MRSLNNKRTLADEWHWRTARRIKNVRYRVKANKAKQPEHEIEVEDDLVIDDDDDLDLIDRGGR